MVNICVEVGEVSGLPERTAGYDKTDPYVKLQIGDKIAQTFTKDDVGAKTVYFGQFVPFDTYGDGQLQVFVMDENRGPDEVLATGQLSLREDYEGDMQFSLALDPINKHCHDPRVDLILHYQL